MSSRPVIREGIVLYHTLRVALKTQTLFVTFRHGRVGPFRAMYIMAFGTQFDFMSGSLISTGIGIKLRVPYR